MKPGSVIVDMAAEQGGNCELTEPGQAVVKHGVTIVGYTDLPAVWLQAVLDAVLQQPAAPDRGAVQDQDGVVNVNMDDDAIRGLTVIKDGSVTWPPPPLKLPAGA